jgi:hypothetical protein
MAVAVLVLPLPLPLTVVDVNRPVTSDASTKRSAMLEVLIVVDMTLSQVPLGVVLALVQGALELLAQTVTVLMAAAALELGVWADAVVAIPVRMTSANVLMISSSAD